MKAEIIAIGSELLLGVTIDTNSAYIARQLTTLGVNLIRKSVVDDHQQRITAVIDEAMSRSDLVICTGGLGPTADDVTRQAAAQALGRPLEFRQELLDQVAARFAAMNRSMSESNHQQAYVPQGARAIENVYGTAPAFIVEDARGTLIVLPGVPRELKGIFEEVIIPYLRDERGLQGVIVIRTLHVTGLGESVIGERIADLMVLDNPTVGTSARHGRCELRIKAAAENIQAAEALLAPVESAIRERLGRYLTGEEPLDHLVLRLLVESQRTLAIYEGNVIPALYRALSAIPDGLDQVVGVIIHPQNKPIDEPTITALARGGAQSAHERWNSDLSVGIQAETQPDEKGFTAVSVVLVSPDGTSDVTRRYDLRQPEGWEYVGNLALETLRRYLVGKEDTGGEPGQGS